MYSRVQALVENCIGPDPQTLQYLMEAAEAARKEQEKNLREEGQ